MNRCVILREMTGDDGGNFHLPTASTCTCRLKLPAYVDRQVMKDKLLFAINHCREFLLSWAKRVFLLMFCKSYIFSCFVNHTNWSEKSLWRYAPFGGALFECVQLKSAIGMIFKKWHALNLDGVKNRYFVPATFWLAFPRYPNLFLRGKVLNIHRFA